MSKRTDAIRSMFAMPSGGALSADNAPLALPRVSAGSVRSLKDTFSDVEQENERLRDQMATGLVAIDLDPASIDPSPLADRFIEKDAPAFEALKASISEKGQMMPVLVRPSPADPLRYQSAYGHRRVRAARELGISVKAYVREMSDEDLVVAQGVENSAREDLSFIERSMFALRLEGAGFQRAVIQAALSIDRAEASKLIAVAKAIPQEIVDAIGRAPKGGRGRWQALADALKSKETVARAKRAIRDPKFATLPSDARFAAVLSAAAAIEPSSLKAGTTSVTTKDGRELALVSLSNRHLKLTIDNAAHEGFAAYLVEKLPELHNAFAERSEPDRQTGHNAQSEL